MKKLFVLFLSAVALLVMAGCANAAGNPGSPSGSASGGSDNVPADYTIPIEEVLEASKDFAYKSIRANVPSRAASTPSEEDKWEGRIQYQYGNWNVPSYFYGINPGQQLVVNGEDLGTLQNLYHVKDNNNNCRKASFVYKDKVYYVFDKGDYVENENYIVLSSADDINHIIFDQKDKTNTPEFSNFKFWVWDRDLANECYRTGDLGYAYTLRNVQMQDGSYATVTVAGYNYYNYGFRVWIKETDGHAVKSEYPQSAPYTFTSTFQKGTFTTVDTGYDFIYEIKNETGGVLKVRNYIRDYNVYDFENGIAAYYGSDFFEIPNNQTQQFKYKLSTLKGYLPFATNNAGIGCRFQLEGNNNTPSGWENNFNVAGRKHTVIVTRDGNYMNGENQWSDL